MSGSLQQALELVRKAIEQDQSGNYAEARTSYTASILLFKRALAEDTSNNPQFQKLIVDKVNEYQQRATVIQQYLQADAAPQGPAAATSPATSSAPRSSSFAPATYNSVASPSASPPAYSSAPAPALPPYSSPASSPPTQPSLRPPTSAGYQPLPPAYGEAPAPAAGSPPTNPSSAPRSSPAPAPALQPHLHFSWFYADHNVSAFVRKWQFSWDSHREKFDVLERRNPYLRSSFSLLGFEGPEKNTFELKDHKVQRFSESANQWEEPMSIGTELRVSFTTDKHAQFIACLPEYKHTLGAEGIDRQWQAWAQTWLGVDVSREHRLVDEADVETEVERQMTHWGKQAVKLKKTVPLESSVIVFEAIVEWATLRPHTAAFTVCSLGRDQQATMEKQFFVFEWPDAPSGRSSELTTAVEEWDAEFDKEVRKYMEELRENMGQPNSRPEPSPRATIPDPDQRSFNQDEFEEEEEDEEEDLSARMRALNHYPQQGQARKDYSQAPERGVPATAPGPAFAQPQQPVASSSLAVAPAASASEVPQQHYRQSPAGQDVSNTILLGELSLLRQEMTLLKEVYITEILALKSMVQTLLQAQAGASTNPSTGRVPSAQPGGPRT